MSERPPIIIEHGVPFFVCPLCVGNGILDQETTEERHGRWFTTTTRTACSHCFGFGRLPVPSWYRELAAQVTP